MKNNLLSGFIKEHVNQYPQFQYLNEINGGLNPNEEYRLRYFQKNVTSEYADSDFNRDDTDSYNTDVSYTDSDTTFHKHYTGMASL